MCTSWFRTCRCWSSIWTHSYLNLATRCVQDFPRSMMCRDNSERGCLSQDLDIDKLMHHLGVLLPHTHGLLAHPTIVRSISQQIQLKIVDRCAELTGWPPNRLICDAPAHWGRYGCYPPFPHYCQTRHGGSVRPNCGGSAVSPTSRWWICGDYCTSASARARTHRGPKHDS